MRGVYFGGKQRYKPGAYSVIDASSSTPIQLGSLRILGIIGIAQGGAPGQIMYFNDPAAAEATLIGGDLLTAAKVAWSPSKTLPGADLIACIRVNPATQATLSLMDSTAAAAITVSSIDYGLWNNNIKIKVETGTTSGIKVTVSYGTVLEVGDNLADNIAITAFLNTSKYVTATKVTDVALANIASTNLTGGTEGTPTATNWTDALSAFATKKIHGIVPITDDASIHASVLTHCTTLSDSGKERRCFVGHAIGEAKSAIVTRANNLNSQRAVQVTPGIKRYGTTLSAVFTAAAIAGMWAGAERTEPLTGDYVDCDGLEVVYTDGNNDFADFENAGVLALEDVDGKGYKVVHAITTYVVDDNPVYVELLKASLADDLAVGIREDLQATFSGRGAVTGAEASLLNRTTTLLNNARDKQKWIAAGTDDAGNAYPAYQNVVVTRNGSAFSVQYEASIIDPINFILITEKIAR